jgi:hypothetical protein
MDLEQALVTFASLLVGCLLIVFRRRFAEKVIEQQNKLWGFRLDRRAIRSAEYIALIVGAGFILAAILGVLASSK